MLGEHRVKLRISNSVNTDGKTVVHLRDTMSYLVNICVNLFKNPIVPSPGKNLIGKQKAHDCSNFRTKKIAEITAGGRLNDNFHEKFANTGFLSVYMIFFILFGYKVAYFFNHR